METDFNTAYYILVLGILVVGFLILKTNILVDK